MTHDEFIMVETYLQDLEFRVIEEQKKLMNVEYLTNKEEMNNLYDHFINMIYLTKCSARNERDSQIDKETKEIQNNC